MKFVRGRAHLQTWGIGEGTDAAEEALNNTFAEYPNFALLELDQDATLKLSLAFQDEGNIDDEPEFRESLDDILAWALDIAESKSAFDALMDKVQASIDRVRKQADTDEWSK